MKKLIVFSIFVCIFGLPGVTIVHCQSLQDIIENAQVPPGPSTPNLIQSDGQQSEKSIHQEPVTGVNNYALQCGTFILENDANKEVIDLKKKGFEPYIFQSVNSKNQTIFAVRIGSYPTRSEAQNALSHVHDKLDLPVFLVRYDSLEPISDSAIAEKKSVTAESSGSLSTATPETPIITSSTDNNEQGIDQRLKSLEEEIQRLKEETDIRAKLRATREEEEKDKTSEDILEAAGREYTLTKEGNLKFSYGLSYSYSNSDAIRAGARVEDVANHSISNSFSVSYGLKDNFSLSTGVPFVYKYHHVGTVDSKSTTGLGDLSLNWKWQPIKPTPTLPTIIVNGSFRIPSGRSPYEINPDEDLSTGSGIYATSLGISLSRTTDPVVVFSSFSLSYPFSVTNINQKRTEGVLEKVDPGMGVGFGCGMGYSLSYRLYLNMSFSYSYSFETEYFYKNAPSAKSGTGTSAQLTLGAGYKYSPRQNLNFNLGIPITDNNGFSFSFSTPIEFEM